jgi:MFS family permease
VHLTPGTMGEPAADAPWEQQVTPQERRFVYNIRYTNILRAWVHTASLVAYNQKYLVMCGGDTGVMAMHAGVVRSCKSVVNVLMSPIVGGLSDSFGRKPMMLYGRFGWVMIWLVLPRVRSLRQWLWVEIIFTGFLRAGDNASQQAALADLFGTRGQLMTQIQAKDGMYSQVAAFFGPVIGELCARWFGRDSTFTCSAMLSVLTMVLLFGTKETLGVADRKPFSVKRANPIASMTLLFRLDKGLRALAVSQFLKDLSGSLMSVLNMFRMGPMRWTPQHVSQFKQFISPTIGVFQGTLVSKIVGRLGLKRGFEVGSLVSALGFVGWSQVWRTAAHGARGWWVAAGLYTAVYLLFISVMPTVANLTMKSMIVKHGLAVSDIGKGKAHTTSLRVVVHNSR